VVYRTGKKLFNPQFGMFWALAYFGSILPLVYFKSGIIDPLFNLFIFIGLYYFINAKWLNDQKQFKNSTKSVINILKSGLFIGLAMLTKGPVAFLIFFLVIVVYWLLNKFRPFIGIFQLAFIALLSFGVLGIWLGLETIQNGPSFMKEFIIYQIRLFSTHDAGHAGFPGFHVIVLLFGCFPASVFAIRGFYRMKQDDPLQNDFRKWMIILFSVVLVLFSVVQSKIVHYSSLAYFPLTFLAALTIREILKQKIDFSRWILAGFIFIAVAIAGISMAIPFFGRNADALRPLFRNNIDALSSLNAPVNWTGWESVTGVLLLVVLTGFIYFIRKNKILPALQTAFIGTALVVMTGLIFFIGRIEMYTQNSHVEFAKSLEGKDGYIETSGFKSYVHLFYSKRKPPVNPQSYDLKWLVWESVDKDVYIVARKHLEEYWQGVPTMEQEGTGNGYVFFKRKK
jgi:4-amino-4-deoxy-L-arabinose transferase-like glycosyltransferase